MRRRKNIRTGIDIGAASVKLVRGVGVNCLERVTHVGLQQYVDDDSLDLIERTGQAIVDIVEELKLNAGSLGRIAVSVSGPETIVREVTLPDISKDEFRQILPFEAKKYLNVNANEIIADGQILERITPDGDSKSHSLRALLAAVTRKERRQLLDKLAAAKIEPEIIDLEPLAILKSLRRLKDAGDDDQNTALAVLDLGSNHATILIDGRGCGLLNRTIWKGEVPDVGTVRETAYLRDIATRSLETMTFFRGRFRREVKTIYLTGGASIPASRSVQLAKSLNREVIPHRPFAGIAEDAEGYEKHRYEDLRFTTACGLCQWGDELVQD